MFISILLIRKYVRNLTYCDYVKTTEGYTCKISPMVTPAVPGGSLQQPLKGHSSSHWRWRIVMMGGVHRLVPVLGVVV
jgi:hypothetical protein